MPVGPVLTTNPPRGRRMGSRWAQSVCRAQPGGSRRGGRQGAAGPGRKPCPHLSADTALSPSPLLALHTPKAFGFRLYLVADDGS